MNITICGSITFLDQMGELERKLIEVGFKKVFKPIGFGTGNDAEMKDKLTIEEDGKRKIDHDLINEHYRKILQSDCILVANYDKRDIANYIGGNTFLEMGFAHVNGKAIFLLNDIPEMPYTSEITGMQPIVLNGDLKLISKYYELK